MSRSCMTQPRGGEGGSVEKQGNEERSASYWLVKGGCGGGGFCLIVWSRLFRKEELGSVETEHWFEQRPHQSQPHQMFFRRPPPHTHTHTLKQRSFNCPDRENRC